LFFECTAEQGGKVFPIFIALCCDCRQTLIAEDVWNVNCGIDCSTSSTWHLFIQVEESFGFV